MKQAGILLPVFSLPGRYGVGTLGKAAFDFVDFLSETGNRIWQILPMGPTGFGNSPYQAFSAFAGNPYFIDLETLVSEGLLASEELAALDFGEDSERVDYGKLYAAKFAALRRAYAGWRKAGNTPKEALRSIPAETQSYCVFMAIKESLGGASWDVWPEALRDRQERAVAAFMEAQEEKIGFFAFLQLKFQEQWKRLRAYAGARDIRILGDIPIYCAPDSADVWAHRELFQYDNLGHPKSVAGVPPDAFSATGQLWGNPLYDWRAHEKSGFRWWLDRMDYCLGLYDELRVDHFRGFEAYYAIPYGEETAENGKWVKGPGMALFEAMYSHFGTEKLPIVAEDLGVITEEVVELMEQTGFPGMKVLQFAWDSGAGNTYLPHNFTTPNCICYTGTHDNDTLRHWFDTLPDWQRDYIYRYTSRSGNDWKFMPELLIKRAMASIADTVIVPAADYLDKGVEARINAPGEGVGNWQWRLEENAFSQEKKRVIAEILGTYGRYHRTEPPAAEETVAEEKKGESVEG